MKTRIKRRFIAFFLTVCMMSGLLPAVPVFGDESYVGSISKNNTSPINYTSLSDLVDAVDELAGTTFEINMLADWGNVRLKIPDKASVTLNMHGHKFDRGLTSGKHNGEVICIGSDSELTINGISAGDSSINRKIGIYHSWKRDGVADEYRTITGAVIAGGYSTNGGGGIDMGSNVTLTLNDVTIAGCRAEQNWFTDGYGGGIWVHGGTNKAGTIIMNRSTITGCYAYNDGGGLYLSNHNKFYLEMTSSHIDSNYCYDQGGGLSIDGESVTIKGDQVSTVSNNSTAGGSGHDGGGIHLWNDEVSVCHFAGHAGCRHDCKQKS